MSRHQSAVYAIISHSVQLPSFDGAHPSFANFQDFALFWPKVAEILIPLHTLSGCSMDRNRFEAGSSDPMQRAGRKDMM
jgi:hypothetical protein